MRRLPLVVASLAVALAECASLTCRAAGARTAVRATLISAPGAGNVSLATAQKRCSFVIYLPTYLPSGAARPRLFFAPELSFKGRYVPERVYANYADGMTLWQMPSFGRPLVSWPVPVVFGDRTGGMSSGPGPGRATIEWIQGGTQLGLSASLPMNELLKTAGSAVQAAPAATMTPASSARRRLWGQTAGPALASGRIGVVLARDAPQRILRVEPYMPAARAGLRPNDAIVEVNGHPLAGVSLPIMSRALRGRPDSTVRLTVLRKGRVTPLQVTLRREVRPALEVLDMTLAQARAEMPFRLLAPQWLPPGYTLLAVSVLTHSGQPQPAQRPQQAQLAYVAAGKPLLLIRQASAPESTRQPSADGIGITAVGPAGVALDWTQGGTAVTLRWGMAAPEQALRVSRSMR